MDINSIAENNPVIVGANPKILSMENKPHVDIITSKSLRRDQEKAVKPDEFCNVESKIIRMGGV